jgi:ADP-ribose pyrophosphatase
MEHDLLEGHNPNCAYIVACADCDCSKEEDIDMTDIKVIETTRIAGSRHLTLWEKKVSRNGNEFPYFMACRGEQPPAPHAEKKPDAVVIVAFWDHGGERRLIITSEYRIPIGTREMGFPAGLIDDKDYENSDGYEDAARSAAIRELKEETGFDFTPIEVSPNNLYSSPGMTNESVVFVFGIATASKNAPAPEELEDIEVTSVSHGELQGLLNLSEDERDFAFGKTSFPFMWSFCYAGFPQHIKV